jgi:predicted P-loop ATPase
MTLHQPKPPLDPWADGVKASDVPVAAKSDFSKVLFPPEEPANVVEATAPIEPVPPPDAPIVKHAIHYATNNGWHVFPAPAGKKKSHKSAEHSDGRNWGMTTDTDEIRRDFKRWPDANIGIVTGAVSGIFVVETDTAAHGDGVDGAASLAALEAEHGALPETRMAISPSGSVHRYFRHPGRKVINSESVIAPGVDVRGDGGMVIAPPSVMPAREATAATPAIPATNGKPAREAKKAKPARAAGAYRWLNDLPVADAPQWLLDRNVPAKTISQRAVDGIKRPPSVEALFKGVNQQRAAATATGGDNFWRRVNDRALDDRSGWVQALFGNRAQLKTISGMQVWRVTSQDLGRDLEEDLSIAPNGIVDFGTEESLTAIDAVMRFSSSEKTDEGAALWLCEQMGLAPEEFGWNKPTKPTQQTAGRAGEPDWRERKINGKPVPCMHNARLAITALGIVCSTDTFHGKTLFGYRDETFKHELQSIVGEVSDDGIIALRQLMSDRFGFDLKAEPTRDAVKSLALENCFDPVRDMIDKAEAEWDGVERLDRMAIDYFNGEDTPINRAFVRKTMIGLVARARNPGCKFDTIMVLESKEGFNKSTAWRVLAGDENFSDESIIGKDSREVQEQLADVWIHENADLAGMKKAEVETVKAYASRQEDRARAAFAHYLKRQPRHSIEVGTTNSKEYLQSQTGNRRFWGMEVLKSIDIEKLKRDRLQLIGEAARYHSQGESVVLDEKLWGAAATAQEERRTKDPWEDILAYIPIYRSEEYIDGGATVTRVTQLIHVTDLDGGVEVVSAADLMEHMLKIPVERQNTANAMRVSNAMKQLGWFRHDNGKVYIGPRRVAGYYRPKRVDPRDR